MLAREYLYSLSINPPAPLTRAEYALAIELIGKRLGLGRQPRAVIYHVKRDQEDASREHCHVVWSRIDTRKMRAIHLAHDHRKLCDLACELAARFGFELPAGLKAWQARQPYDKPGLEPTIAENAQAADTGITPAHRQAEITAAYEEADSAAGFRTALAAKGYFVAKGDRRALVVVSTASSAM